MTLKFLAGIVLVFAACTVHAQACERPQINKHLSVSQVTGSGFQLSWSPVEGATHYELKILLRVPEGRVLAQSEALLTSSFFNLGAEHLAHVEVAHLVTELVAFCEASQSEAAFAQLALYNPQPTCRFDAQQPVLKKQILSWLPVKGAHSYTVCQFKEHAAVSCHETFDAQNTLRLETRGTTRLIAITPVCRQSSGLPHFLAVDDD